MSSLLSAYYTAQPGGLFQKWGKNRGGFQAAPVGQDRGISTPRMVTEEMSSGSTGSLKAQITQPPA